MSDEVSLMEQLDDLDRSFQNLQSRSALSGPKGELGEIDGTISRLSQQVVECRARGYRYKSYLEGKVATLANKWRTARPAMQQAIAKAEKELKPLYDEIAGKISSLQRITNEAGLRGQLDSLRSKVEHFEGRLEAAEAAVNGASSPVSETMWQTEAQLREVMWLLDNLEQASFPIQADENPIQAVKAKWWRDGKNKGPSGVLYLTDLRILFEHKEEVATKKVLFIATEKETIQELLFEAPVTSVESVQSSSKGLFGHEDHLDFTLGAGAEYSQAHFHIDGQDSDWWVGLVNRTRSGEIRGERYYQEGEEAAGATGGAEIGLSDAPDKCSSCGAPFEAPVAKGQRQITCEYCGMSMRW